MNKTYLIAGGVSVASLAVGTTAGYFLAKKKFDARLEGLIALEVHKTKKHYSVLLMQAREGKPESPADIPPKEDEPLELEAEDNAEVIAAKEMLKKKGERLERAAGAALTNYAGFAKKPDLGTLVQNHNIFTKDSPKKKLPPRDPTGKFTPKAIVEEPVEPDDPYLIDEETFLLNEPENDQDSVLYFAKDNTAVLTSDYNDVVDNGRIGEANLTLFPDDEPSVIYVRNNGLGIDYQITRTYESLTAAMGLGEEEDEDVDTDEYALQE